MYPRRLNGRHAFPARTGRNPRTGKMVESEAKGVPHFKPGKEIRARLNT